MLQSIFFYETGPVVLNSTRKLFMQLCTIVFVENVFALKEELQVAIDIGSVKQLIWYFYLCLNSFLLCELLFDYPCYCWLYACAVTVDLYSFHYWMFYDVFFFNHVYVNDINDQCGNIASIALLHYLSIVIMNEIMSMSVK